MEPLDRIVADARARGIRPWIALKERMAERALQAIDSGGGAILQGGGALHFVYGSPRLSADLDFVGPEVHRVLERQGEKIASAVTELLGLPARWAFRCSGRMARGKVTVEVDAARRLVLPVEAYAVPARRTHSDPRYGPVESAQEIAADKIVASADRLARWGTLKTRDLFDLWFIATRLDVDPPDPDLVVQKVKDYGQPLRAADLGAAARGIPLEELAAALEGVLPSSDLAGLQPGEIRDAAATWLEMYRDVL